jgi:AraC-like DNA-binding protein
MGSTSRVSGDVVGDPVDILVREGAKALARREGVSFRTLRRRFKDGGVTVFQARITRRASMVVNLLQDKHADLHYVSRTLGYSSVSAFAKFVRREFGVTPATLQRELSR